MAASAAPARQPRRGPAPIASFDHDGSDEVSKPSSPEGKPAAARLPEIREDAARGAALAPPEPRARSLSTPGTGALAAPPAPRIDISRASSSSHHDSRDSSPELALFAGGNTLELAFREDGALDLRSSTEELAFLEPAPGETPRPAPAPPPRPASAAPAAPAAPVERRHSRKDSQCSEAALLGVSGRTSRLSSVGSQCSALSRVSRLSAASAASRSPSPHRMLLETSFCGPKPIETDPEISAGALVDQILGLVDDTGPPLPPVAVAPPPVDARDRREVRTEVTLESARPPAAPPAATPPAVPPAAPPAAPLAIPVVTPAPIVSVPVEPAPQPAQPEERRARPRIRREPSEPEVYKSRNKSKDIIRIKLRPDDSCEDDEDDARTEAARKPASLALSAAARPASGPPAPDLAAPGPVAPGPAAPVLAASPSPSRRRSPSPAGPPVSRKSSFCSLFKSRETIASPESPSEALRRKRSLTEGRSRSKSRDRSATPTSATKIRGSVLSLFRTPRRSAAAASPGSPGAQGPRPAPAAPPPDRRRAADLKYYEDSSVIHIPLRTPPDEHAAPPRRSSGGEPAPAAPREPRPASAPQPRAPSEPAIATRAPVKPIHRTVLPDGSIIIPLHSPTERAPEIEFPESARAHDPPPPAPKERTEDSETVVCRAETSLPAITPMMTPTANGEIVSVGTGSPGEPERVRVPEPREAAEAGAGAADAVQAGETARRRRKERLVFTTHVGSREQVFSTQFSITKTPSVTSEISGSFSSFAEGEPPALRDTHIATPSGELGAGAGPGSAAGSPPEQPRDSSESEASSEAAAPRAGNDVEQRVLVVAQESFEEELPYVPTTLPQERPVALPMVPVRERGGVRVSGVQRPRAAAPPARPAPQPAPAPAQSAPPADKLRIKLPRRPRPASAPRPHRPRTKSGGDSSGGESRSKAEWIDFEEVPERRKQPKRIQTLPGGAPAPVFSYVEPEHCRCECHASARPEDQLPLLAGDLRASVISTSSTECGEAEPAPAEDS